MENQAVEIICLTVGGVLANLIWAGFAVARSRVHDHKLHVHVETDHGSADFSEEESGDWSP
jgi:hypothetical protein